MKLSIVLSDEEKQVMICPPDVQPLCPFRWLIQSGHWAPGYENPCLPRDKAPWKMVFRCYLTDLPGQFSEMVAKPDQSTLYNWRDYMIDTTNTTMAHGPLTSSACEVERCQCYGKDITITVQLNTSPWAVAIAIWAANRDWVQNIDVRDLLPAWGDHQLKIECARLMVQTGRGTQSSYFSHTSTQKYYSGSWNVNSNRWNWNLWTEIGYTEVFDNKESVQHQGHLTTPGLRLIFTKPKPKVIDNGESDNGLSDRTETTILTPAGTVFSDDW
ncbi:hypothetical protein QBC38DRAFT_543861 [Podospora fimiseda]|uniref:Uncharacterized protein n=1 Tax=Podospora fimiseda TaxID=252190 RepID=A0AAN7H4L0_9PEZI|nr:hypothetical protein QBC38DRAFT_543861 [Podospora fimiseda]